METTAQAYLELLRALGVKYLLGNPGTDFAPIIDAFAKFVVEGKTAPRPISVPHEFCAVSMAHGTTMVTGEPQVVMVHTTVGTANALGALINASRARAEHNKQRESWGEEALRKSKLPRINLEWLSRCLNQLADRETIIVNEYDLRLHHFTIRTPGNYFSHSPAGCLGWGVGAALGVKLAAPDKTVVAVVGERRIFPLPASPFSPLTKCSCRPMAVTGSR